jgi:DNA repair/transcription protein MET18/MMS19
VVPHFIQLFHNPDEAPTRLGNLTLLREVIDSARNSARQDGDNSVGEPALMRFKDEVLGLYITGLQSTSLRTVALSGLKSLVLTDDLLADEEIGYIVHKVNDIIAVDQDDSDETRLVILSPLILLSDTLFVAKRS